MLLSEHLILEALHEEKEPIFDRPELIDVAKNVFVNGKVTCHALDLTRHDMSFSKWSDHLKSNNVNDILLLTTIIMPCN